MSYKTDRRFYTALLKIFVVLALVGVALLVYTSLTSDPSTMMFSLIAFVISVAALVMTTLQSLTISRQLHITERAIELVREADDQLEALAREDKKLSREIRQDLALDKQIVEALEEVGVGTTSEERHHVAKHIASQLARPKHNKKDKGGS